jgi:hypothetical protein
MEVRLRRVARKALACCLLSFIIVLVSHRGMGQLGNSVRLSGYVSDQSNGAPIPGALIDIQDDKGQRLISLTTNTGGFYEVSVPWASVYRVGTSVWADIYGYTQLRFIPASTNISPGDATALRVDFVLRPGVNLVLKESFLLPGINHSAWLLFIYPILFLAKARL